MINTMGAEKRKSLSEVTAEKIITYIQDNHLSPGDQLPNELVFSDMLEVGRGTVREAIKTLVSRNIVFIKHGCGTYVADNPGVSADPLGFQFIEDKRQLVIDLLELRKIIEPALAQLASQRALTEEISKLSEIEDSLEDVHRVGNDHTALDVAFHEQLAVCSHNHVTELLIPVLTQGIPAAIEYTGGSLIDESILDHRKIIEALRRRDGESAQSAVREHLDRNIRFILGE